MVGTWFFILGLCFGSFVNVLVLRLKRDESLLGRSRCLACLKQLHWYHNLPLVSFVALRGRCAYCRAPISWQYPMVELACGLLWLMGYLVFAQAAPATCSPLSVPCPLFNVVTFGLFASLLLALFVFDVRWYELPDELTLPGIALGLALNLARGYAPLELLAATAIGAAFFLAQYAVSRGKWVGSGDVRLGAMIGAMAGTYVGLTVTLLLAYVAGSLVGLVLVALRRKNLESQLPFGAFLAPAALVSLLWGQGLWQWYLGLLGW